MEYKTYNEWLEEGYQVMKGEKSTHTNKLGRPTFSEKQVTVADEYDETDYEITGYDLAVDWYKD